MLEGNSTDAYWQFQERLNGRLQAAVNAGLALFQTDVADLWDVYIASYPAQVRQYHTCTACRHFLQRYGGLVTIDEAGRTKPLLHADDAEAEDHAALAAVVRAVKAAAVTGPFLASEEVWGQPVTGVWRHMGYVPPPSLRFKSHLTAGQVMAERRADFNTVRRALAEYTPQVLDLALALLASDALYRAEKVIGPARWLRDLHAARAAVVGKPAKDNVLWRAVASAPAGFCHPRSSMVGTLLDDLAAGLTPEEVSRRFAAKMHPLQYQRPSVAPSAGAITNAERLVDQLGIAASLARRYARLDEIQTVWRPRTPVQASGVFGHLRQPSAPLHIPASSRLTWEKFARVVLPAADRIELQLSGELDSFSSLLTATNPDAPPILQWDQPTQRNPFSWYYWHGGSRPEQFGLSSGWHPLSAVALKPTMWYGHYPQHGKGVMFVIYGARDSKNTSLCLFPETLKSELHGVRSVVEAHSRSRRLDGAAEASAAGLLKDAGQTWCVLLRVTTGNVVARYTLDRWD